MTITRTHTLWIVILAILAVLALLSMRVRVAAAAEPQDPSYWMQKKLEYSQGILVGLAKGDFAAIEKNASTMNHLSQIEKWVRAGAPEYKAQLAAFRTANKNLVRMAKEQDIDGATLAYMQLTQSCVHCHKLIRDPGK